MNMQCFLQKKLPSPTIVDENQKLWESKPNFKIKLTLQTYVKPYFFMFEEGDIGGYPILQYRKTNWQIPKYCVENRQNTDTAFMIGHTYLHVKL